MLTILNNVFQHSCFLDADTAQRISRFHAAISDVHRQLYCSKVSLYGRVKLLSSLGGAAMMWSIESTSLCNTQLVSSRSAFLNQVFKMHGKRHTNRLDISLSNRMAIQRRHCCAVVNSACADVVTHSLRRHWNYVGHIARNNESLLRILTFRGQELVLEQRSKHHRARSAICS